MLHQQIGDRRIFRYPVLEVRDVGTKEPGSKDEVLWVVLLEQIVQFAAIEKLHRSFGLCQLTFDRLDGNLSTFIRRDDKDTIDVLFFPFAA
jgi:hypothetical protein